MILQNTLMPEQASEMAWHVDSIIWYVTIVTGVTGIGVYLALLVFFYLSSAVFFADIA